MTNLNPKTSESAVRKKATRQYRGHTLVAFPGVTLWCAHINRGKGGPPLMTDYLYPTSESALDYAATWLDRRLPKTASSEKD